MAMFKCDECGHDVSSFAKCCKKCGNPVDGNKDIFYCSECNNLIILDNNEKECSNCGAPIEIAKTTDTNKELLKLNSLLSSLNKLDKDK